MLQDFKNFAMKGNVVDLAVGVIIGAAFSKIVKSRKPRARSSWPMARPEGPAPITAMW